jgi:hypothetical protein
MRRRSARAAFTIAMVLQARNVGLDDVAMALQQIEPICASGSGPTGTRPVPMRAISTRDADAVDDIEFVAGRSPLPRGHRRLRGSETITALAGALEAI